MSEQSSIEVPLLTYNSLYNLLREEKKGKSLQKLPELFYSALENFLKTKKEEIEKFKKLADNDKLRKEKLILINSKKIALELTNLRFSKISNIAIKNKLFGDDVLSQENVLEDEQYFFDSVQKALNPISKKI
jgi:DNA replication initiation complex subunit (GINS family)